MRQEYQNHFLKIKSEIENLITRYRSGKITVNDNIIKGKITAPPMGIFETLPPVSSQEYDELFKSGIDSIKNGELGMVILNGGMATRFGGVVKGTVRVFDGKSFLQLKIESSLKISPRIKFFIMNSFATEEETVNHLKEKDYFGVRENISIFNQFIAPRITLDGNYFDAADKRFYGPGHGDFPYAFRSSGLLDEFISAGGKHIFFSNVDNLGAKVEPALLGFHILKGNELTAEVAEKLPGDEGGAPALIDGKLQLVEGFSFPKDFDSSSIGVFNCSTYWVNAADLKKDFTLPWYIVEKKVDGTAVIQFEHLAGDMTRFFTTNFIKVPRGERFLPVKKPEDLEKIRQKLKKVCEA